MNSVNLKNNDELLMDYAIKLAIKGKGRVNPNPLVGAVIVKDGEIIGEGYHEKYGEAHAEVNAIKCAEKKGKNLQGATIYVTLEPCSHFGKTPPCADLIVKKKFARCVIGSLDPNEKVSGKGIEKIKNSGIEVKVGVLDDECRKINRVFFKYITAKMPYVFLKCGITLDGKIATKTGNSKWITNSKAREKVQEYRNEFTGIMVGINTVLNDNPGLRTGIKNGRDPYRIIIDSELKTPEEFQIIEKNNDLKTIIITQEKNLETKKFKEFENKYKIKFITLKEEKFKMKDVLLKIGELGIDSILLEGGSGIITQFFKENLIDAGEIFISPKILGDSESIPFIGGLDCKNIDEGIKLDNVKYEIYDDNIGVQFYYNR